MRSAPRTALVLIAVFALSACGGRPLAAGADGAVEPTLQPDAGATPFVPDARCISPAGLCHSSQECADDQVCSGCFSDPCSPTNACLGTCAPLPKTACSANAECPTGAYCEHDGLCVVTGGKAGSCKKLPVCPDTGAACFGVCGCDGNTYCSPCEAHAAGVSVAVAAKACLAPTCAALDQLYSAEIEKAKTCCPMCAALQCAVKVAPLWCGCETHVNTISPTMTALQAEFLARGCAFVMPPCGVKCQAPMPGYCGLNGVCIPGGD
jgi:hypothetical protein